MDGKHETWKKLPIWRWVWVLLFSSVATIQARSIIPTLTILSSTIPTSRFQSTSSIFHSSDNLTTDVSNEIDLLGTLQQLNDNEASTEIDIKPLIDDSDVDIDYLESDNEEKEKNTERKLDTLVSIVTTTATPDSLIVNDIAAFRPPVDPTNDTSIVKLVESRPTQHPLSTITANAIFVYSLAIISGFGEICCLKSYGCFINMVTGSSVRIFMGLAEGQFHTIRLPICVTIGYVTGIIFARIMKYHYDSIDPTANEIDTLSYEQSQSQIRPTISNSRFRLKTLLRSISKAAPKQRRNSSSELLWSVTPYILILFSATELINIVLNRIHISSVIRIPLVFNVLLQSIGYGLVAQIMSDVQTTTPANVYVLTGHYVTVTKSFIDQYLQRGETTNIEEESSTMLLSKIKRLLSFVPTAQQRQSIDIVLLFGIGAIIAALMHKYLAFLLPFQHTLTGMLYTLTFLWYSIRLSNVTT